MSINRAVITGNLTRDPELRTTATGMSVLRFSVAVNDRRKVGEQWQDVANYIDCVLFGTRGEALSRYLSKGSKVGVEGKLRWSQWEDRNTGQKRSKIEIVVDDLEFLSPRNGSYAPAQLAAPSQQPAASFSAPSQDVPAAPEPQQTAPNTYQNIPPAPPSTDAYDAEDIPF